MILFSLSELPNVLRFQVPTEVNSECNFEDVKVDLKLSFLKLIYGTWLVEIAI